MGTLEEVARRLVWWKGPAVALADRSRFLAQVMVFGTGEDLAAVRQHFPGAEFREVMRAPPPGVFDPRSWAYWHLMLDMGPPPPLPRRRLPDEEPAE